ncbi:MAG TPA: SHOCT domain-containing protein, partial [Mycobacteriales bacterium]|nr:SHOCT domain-containing protein [Mycobacteriales bacterium]
MTSQDDLTLLKQMYQRGEITDEEYDVLRRHVLWGTPLPELMDEPPAAPGRPAPPAARTPVPPPPRGAPPAGRDPGGPPTGR